MLPDASYEAATVEIADGDLLVMYSDGLVEAANDTQQEYGDARLVALLQTHGEETPAQLRKSILSSLAAFASPDVLQDDLTFAIVRFGTRGVRNAAEPAMKDENLPVGI